MNPIDARYFLDAIKSTGRKLSPWSDKFLASIEKHLESRRYLSSPQSAKLQQIYRETSVGEYQIREFIR